MDVNFEPCRGRRPGKAKSPGFSLIELIIVLAVAGVMLTIVAPSFSSLIDSTRMTTQLNTLVSALSLSRSEAVKTGRNVILCKSIDGQWCDHHAEWRDGWLIFADTNRDRTRNPSEPILRIFPELGSGHTLRFNSSLNLQYVQYNPTGEAINNGTFTFCDKRGSQHARALIIFRSGRVRSSGTTGSGESLVCPDR